MTISSRQSPHQLREVDSRLRVSRNQLNMYTNLMHNLMNRTLNAKEAMNHILFWSPAEQLQFLTSFQNNLPKPEELNVYRAANPNHCGYVNGVHSCDGTTSHHAALNCLDKATALFFIMGALLGDCENWIEKLGPHAGRFIEEKNRENMRGSASSSTRGEWSYYDGRRFLHLLRFLRNYVEHCSEHRALHVNLVGEMGVQPSEILEYVTRIFPAILTGLYVVAARHMGPGDFCMGQRPVYSRQLQHNPNYEKLPDVTHMDFTNSRRFM